MIQLALAGLGEVLALYPLEGSHEPITSDRSGAGVGETGGADPGEVQHPNDCAECRKSQPLRARGAVAVRSPPAPQLQKSDDREHASAVRSERTAEAAASDARDPATTRQHPRSRCGTTVPSGPDNLLRVDAERIDSVLNLVGELILAKSMLQQTLLEFGRTLPERCSARKIRRCHGLPSAGFERPAAFGHEDPHGAGRSAVPPLSAHGARRRAAVRKRSRAGRPRRPNRSRQEHSGRHRRTAHPPGAQCDRPWHRDRRRARARRQTSRRERCGWPLIIRATRWSSRSPTTGTALIAEKVRQRALSQGLLKAEQAARLTETETLDLILQAGILHGGRNH